MDDNFNVTMNGEKVSWGYVNNEVRILPNHPNHLNPEDYEVTQLSDDMRNLILSAPGVKIDENGVISIDGINISRVVVDDEEIYSRTKRDDVDK